MPTYRCGICNVFSSSLDQHAKHLDGARHKRNEAAALAGESRVEPEGRGRKAKRARQDADAVDACLRVLDGATPAEKRAPPPLRDRLLRKDDAPLVARLPTECGGDLEKYANGFREAVAIEARHNTTSDEGKGRLEQGPQSYTVVRCERDALTVDSGGERGLPPDAFVRVTVRGRRETDVVARFEGSAVATNRVLRCREGTAPAFLKAAVAAGSVRVEEFDSVIAMLRADAALARSASKPAAVVLALARDGAGETRRSASPRAKEDDPWTRATDAAGRTYYYHKATRETRWSKPEKPAWASSAEPAAPSASDWITATVLGAVDDAAPVDAPAAPVAAETRKAPLDTTISLIHGPPGTGKTSELARLLVAERGRVLACAPSNRATLELCDRYLALGRGRATLLGVGKQCEAHAAYSPCRTHQDRDAARSSQVVFCTLATAGRSDLRDILASRDLLAVDEAGQALEPDVVSAADASRARRLILCGDPQQLPPVLASKEAEACGLNVSPMERLLQIREQDPERVALRFLDEQRRMHPAIASYPNRAYYGGRVRDAAFLSTRSRPDWLPYSVRVDAAPLATRGLYDVSSGRCRRDGSSLYNEREVEAVVDVVAALLRSLSARAPADIAVISFYQAQVRALDKALDPYRRRLAATQSLRVGTVDAFQGGEADVVLISAVRAPLEQGARQTSNVGFVADARRFNVALTRARHVLGLFCHAETLGSAAEGGLDVEHVQGIIADAYAAGDVVDACALRPRDRE